MTYSTNLRLSDQAYDTLRELPIILDRADHKNISRFLKECASANAAWRDIRPEYALSIKGPVKAWHDGSVKRYRRLGVLPNEYLLKVAEIHGILPYSMQTRAIAGKSYATKGVPYESLRTLGLLPRYTPAARITAVLEAIGLQWLTLEDVSCLPRPLPRIAKPIKTLVGAI